MSSIDAGGANRHWSRLAIICPILASVAFVIELAIIPMVLPTMQAEFGLTDGEVVWVYNSYGVAVAGAVLLGGLLGDRDRRRIFRLGVVLFALGAALTALAANRDLLLAGRFLQGAGGGLFSVVVPVLLSQSTRDRPGRVLVVWGGIAGIAATVSPFIAGFALTSIGWRPIVGVIGFLSFVALALPKPHGNGSPLESSEPGGMFSVVRNPRVWAILGYIFLTYGSFLLVSFEVPRQVQTAGFDEQAAGAVVALLWFTFAVMSIAIRDHVDGPLLNRILFTAPLLTGGAALLLLHQNGLGMIVGSTVAVGVGLALCNGPSTHVLLRLVSDRQKSLSASLDIMAARFGGAAIIWLIAGLSLSMATAFIVVLSLLAILLGAVGAWQGREDSTVSQGGAAE